MKKIGRRSALKVGLSGLAGSLIKGPCVLGQSAAPKDPRRKGRIHQSVARWCYKQIPLDQLCSFAAEIGLKGVDLLQPGEFEIPQRYGLRCTMGYAGGGEINKGLNRLENHDLILENLRKNIPLAAKAGVPNVITFSGVRAGMADEEGARNTVTGLKRIRPIAEDHNVTVCLELLNSKINHPDYMCDHTAWGVNVVEEINSPKIKLLYDIYHMQIMEGDLIDTITRHHQWLGHFHTGGVPGRHELNEEQEVRWDAVMRAIAATSFAGYVAHEFVPSGDPFTGLRQAVDVCDV
ncbi:MAG: TIM barrel protein [Acidobacteriaceae bacterium]